jgi:hypothetical protein
MSEAVGRPRMQAGFKVGTGTGPAIGAIFLGIGLATGLVVELLGLDRLPFPVCVFKAVTGVPCMTCGTTRTLACLVHLNLAGALAMNPLATLVALAVVVWGLADLVLMPWGRALAIQVGPETGRGLRIGAVVIVLLNWAYLVAAGR